MKRRNTYLLIVLFVVAAICLSSAALGDTLGWEFGNASASQGFINAICNGDLNDDGQIDTSDVNILVNVILIGDPGNLCADLNNDEVENVLDLQLLINHILNPQTGNVYYISPTGSDSNDGSLERPWNTVAHAWDHSGRGDTIYVREGTYTEGRNIWLVGGNRNEAEFWTLKAYPGETATFTNARFIADNDYIRIQGLHLTENSMMQAVSWDGIHEHIEFLDNVFEGYMSPAMYFICNNGLVQGNRVDLTGADSHGLYIMHGSNNVIRNNYVKGAYKYGIHIYDEEKYPNEGNVSIKNYLVENNVVSSSEASSGIIISGGDGSQPPIVVDGVVIRNNILIHNNSSGISIAYKGHIRNIHIYNNTIHGNNRGIRISAEDVDDVVIKNNIFSNNQQNQIDISANLNNLIISHNLYHQPSSVGTGATDDSPVFDDPLFVNPAGGDFHLQANSPAIDAGIDVGMPYNGPAPDLGAFEYGQ